MSSSQTSRKNSRNGQFDRFLEAVGPIENAHGENANLFSEFDMTFRRLAAAPRRQAAPSSRARRRKAPSPSLSAIDARSLNRA